DLRVQAGGMEDHPAAVRRGDGMERGRPVLGVAVALLAFAGVPSALLSAGASPTTTTACGSLSRGAGAPGTAGTLSSAAFVSAGGWGAVGNGGCALHADQ